LENSTLLVLITIFIGITTCAMFIQGLAIFGMYKRFKQLSTRMEAVADDTRQKIQVLTESVRQALDSTQSIVEKARKTSENLLAVSETVKFRMADLDRLTEESAVKVRRQVYRFEQILDKSASRLDQTLDIWYNQVISPAMEIGAVVKGCKVGLNFFLSGRRRSRKFRPNSTPDEELFI